MGYLETGDLKEFLDQKVIEYNNPSFINSDPVSIPHRFKEKADIEISGFLVATIAWGQRKTIINNGFKLIELMNGEPYKFITSKHQIFSNISSGFKHRTFNGFDLIYFLNSLRNIYLYHGGLQNIFESNYSKTQSVKQTICQFRSLFLSFGNPGRSSKHISNPNAGSAAKRINMFLRWMVRSDNNGVDFGLWKGIPASSLLLPLDLHTGNVSRKLGLLKRKQNDWKAVEEITTQLRLLDPADPVKYDYALFGIGVNESSIWQ